MSTRYGGAHRRGLFSRPVWVRWRERRSGFGTLRIILIWLWGCFGFIYFRKIINTFRPTAKLLGRLQGEREIREKDAFLWKHGGHFSPDFYASLGVGEMSLVDYVCAHAGNHESILDICCNQGRFLLELKQRGFKRLHGFDIMGPAIQKLRENQDYHPDLTCVEHCLAQEYFLSKKDNVFDWAITYSATIELIHPEFDIFRELGRTVRKGMFLVLSEDGHSYPRFYRLLHRMNNFKIVAIARLEGGLTLIHSVKKQGA